MIRYALYMTVAAGMLSSCSYNWQNLDPTHVEPTLVNDNKPVLRTLEDGRDISGYPIPHSEVKGKSAPSAVVPEGMKTAEFNTVISPYSPHKKLDASSVKDGDLVRDPETKKVFRIPVRRF